jgi:hypothetical protein
MKTQTSFLDMSQHGATSASEHHAKLVELEIQHGRHASLQPANAQSAHMSGWV